MNPLLRTGRIRSSLFKEIAKYIIFYMAGDLE